MFFLSCDNGQYAGLQSLIHLQTHNIEILTSFMFHVFMFQNFELLWCPTENWGQFPKS